MSFLVAPPHLGSSVAPSCLLEAPARAEEQAQSRGQLPVPSLPEPSPALALWVSPPVCQGPGKRAGRREGMVPGDKVQSGRGRGKLYVGTDL